MQNRQRGMTFLGMGVMIVVVGAWVYAGIRLVPSYLENMKIAATLEKVSDEYDSNPDSSEVMLRRAIEKHFDIESVTVIDQKDVQIKREGAKFKVRAAYEDVIPMVANISFLVSFDKTVEINAR